jgi:transposase
VIFGSPPRVRVFVYREPVDMRKAYDTLSALVEGPMKKSLLSGDVFAFIGRTRKRAKALYFDGTGLCLLSKRLEVGHFAAPWKRPGEGPLQLTMSELALLFEGSELALRVRLSPAQYLPMADGAHA